MTVIGDAVNLTARIESATKMFGVPLLVSDDLFAETGRSIRHRAVHQPSAGPVFSVQVVTALA
jgi:class 3 adenylate cyclase